MPTIAEADVLALVRDYADRTHGHDAPRAALDLHSDLADFGLDSTDLICLAAEFEDMFGIAVNPVLFISHDSIGLALRELEQSGDIALVSAPAVVAGDRQATA